MNKNKYKSEEVWFTSDLHFGHKNILDYCNRPFNNVDDMNEGLIANWNSVVEESDHIFILGDLSFAPMGDTLILLSQLQGRKHLILGNHDFKRMNEYENCNLFESVDLYKEIYIDSSVVCLFHFPIERWNAGHKGSYHLHGHIHSNDGFRKGKRMDVGVDGNNYTPVSWLDIKMRLNS